MLKDKALFLYGFDVTPSNRSLNFRAVSLGPVLTATLNLGNYTGTQFCAEVKRAMELVDPANTYTITIDRTVSAGTSNRLHVTTSGAYLDILFSSGLNALASPRFLMGFDLLDYTGATSYSGYTNCGVILIPELPTYNYVAPGFFTTAEGAKNVSANGIKETLVFAQVLFFQGEWRYITDVTGSNQATQWTNFMLYATRQLQFEFSPSINENPNSYQECTLESTPQDGNGMGFQLQLMQDVGLYRFYKTGTLKFRVNQVLG